MVAVYVIGADRTDFPVKVGYSRKPESRLSSLQMGIWFYIHILGMRYVESEPQARKVEKEAHKILSASGKALLGEWFDASPAKAVEAIEWAALTVGVDLIEPEITPAVPKFKPMSYSLPPPPTEEELAAQSRARQQRREQRGRY